MEFSPQFGGKLTEKDYERIKKSKNFQKGKFKNIEDTHSMTSTDLRWIIEYFTSKDTTPNFSVPVENSNLVSYNEDQGDNVKVIWFGHSALLLEINNKKIFLDPMLSEVPAPHPMLGSKRFSTNLPMGIDEIPELDAVVISHDHYDHLDYVSIKKLKDKVKMFYVPLGIGAHLKSWGVEETKIVELDWWQEAKFEELTFISTPSRHFSGRGLFNRDSTLWSSWVIKGKDVNIFFSGDSGYSESFKEIGEKFGPFDLTMIECGQYHEAWSKIHMMPEETVKAHIDLKGKLLLPIHWGAFKLSLHPWDEPVERLLKEANSLNVSVTTPKIGETVILGKSVPSSEWWKK
ncbi:MBL fold metallo-hydrolase [Anaeromicrobium sediminis]|nr:MBL fold metallo-hydrolase [Anaeromicrobium sediminis]